MNLWGIALYTLRAFAFALIAWLAYALLRRTRRRRPTGGGGLTIFYLAALFQITVLRGGVEWDGFFSAPRAAVQWIPLQTTLDQFRRGTWPFLYHVLGNLAWFVPMGFLARRKPAWVALALGAAFSAFIEGMQWALMTGMPDVDDVLLNATGALVGRLLAGVVGTGNRFRSQKPG